MGGGRSGVEAARGEDVMDVDGLIERLRKDAPPLGLEYWDPTYDVRQEAATALATLRDEREAAWASVQPEIEKRKAAEAERDRLRDALRSIAANTCCDTCREAALAARAALDDKPRSLMEKTDAE